MNDNKNNSHDLGSVLAIVAYTLLLIYYFKIWGLIISFSTIFGFLIISKNEKAVKDLLLKIKANVEKLKGISIPIWITKLIVVLVLGALIVLLIAWLTPPVISSVTLDTTSPSIDQNIRVTVNAMDNVGVTSVTANGVSLNAQGSNIWTGTLVALVGTNSVNVSASDAAGNIVWNNATGYISIDGTPPMEFVLIPAGEFDMGSPQNEAGRDDDEGPVHRVRIESAFYMSKYEITQRHWRDIMGTDPSYFKGNNLPVEQVSWNEVQEFISRLNEKEGTDKYRLPSEAEWEYAARAGTTTRFCFGNDASKLSDYEWYDGNATHEVGKKEPNPWGLYDMHGNVWEWVQDVYHNSYNGAPIDGSAWEGNGSHRIIRGGSFDYAAIHLRAANRNDRDPGFRHKNTGFRLVMDS